MHGGWAVEMWILAFALLVLAVGAMHWGASSFAGMFRNFCRRVGLTAVGGATLLGLATASPEITVNVAAVSLGWPDIGLGTALGSNVPALPLIFLLSWLAGRRTPPEDVSAIAVKQETGHIQAAPYLAVVLLLAALTLPPPLRGLQWQDAVILAGAYAAYVTWALVHGQRPGIKDCPLFGRGDRWRMLAAPFAVAGGALLAVLSCNYLVEHFRIPPLIGGLFFTGLLCALPESFAAWHLALRGQATAAVSGAMADGTASLTIAFLALGAVEAPLADSGLYAIHLVFLAAVLLLFVIVSRRGGTLIVGPYVAVMGAAYCLYLLGVVLLA